MRYQARMFTMQTAFAVCIVLSDVVSGQPPDTLWTRSYRLGTAPVCHRLVSTSDGGFALGVQTDNGRNMDWGLIKVDSTGQREWSRIYGSSDTLGALHDVLYGLAAASDGGYYLAGQWNRDMARLMRVDAAGREVWSGNFEFRGNDNFIDITLANDGNVICAEYGGGNFDALDVGLVKFDDEGNVIWQQTYGSRGTDIFTRVITTSNSGFLAVGWTTSFGGMKAYAVKADSLGNEEWSNTFNFNPENHAFLSVVESPEGGYLAVGHGEFNGSLRLYWARMTADGDSLWSGVLEHENDGAGYLLDAAYAPNGGFLIVGKSREHEYAAYRLNRDGEILWRFDIGDLYDPWFEAVLTLDDGGYLLGGKKDNPPISTDAWLIRTAPDPEFNSVQLLDPAFPTSWALSPPYPNPFNSNVQIDYSIYKPTQTSIRIYNQLGHQVAELYSGNLVSGYYRTTWDASGQAAGIYFCKLLAGSSVETRKLLLVK